MMYRSALAFTFVSMLALPGQAASKKGGKAPVADAAQQNKATSIFLTVLSDWYAEEGPGGITVPVYTFDAAAKRYVLKDTKLNPYSAEVLPGIVTTGVATVATMFTTLETNYETGTEEGSVPKTYPIFARVANEAAEKVFGHGFIEKRLEEKGGGAFMMYSPTAFENAFTMFYAKPSETRGGVVLQKLYDALFKAAVAKETETFAKVLSKRKAFEAKAKDLLKRAETDENFYGGQFAYQAAVELNGGTIKDGEATAEPLIEPSLMGSLLRRQADGTLPVLLRSLKTVLKDYDPDALKMYGGQL